MLGTESKLDKDNGELSYRGRHIFMGYMYVIKRIDTSMVMRRGLYLCDLYCCHIPYLVVH